MDNLNTNINFEEQRQQLLSIRREIRLLSQQVDFLLRNEKPLGLLDVDVLMNRTHTLYDMLCAIETDHQENFTEEDFDEDMVNVLASAVVGTADNSSTEQHIDEPNVQDSATQHIDEPVEHDLTIDDTPEPEIVEEPAQPEAAEMSDGDENFIMSFDEAPAEEKPQEYSNIVDDYLYTMEQEEKEREESAEQEPVEKVLSDPIFEIITPSGDDSLKEEEPEEEPEQDMAFTEENSFDRPEEPLFIPDETPSQVEEEVLAEPERVEPENVSSDNQPSLFDVVEPEQPEQPEQTVLGEKMITEDNTLAAKLQNRPVGDLKSAIGINDKFLFVNELFGGSMEKYNRSIENLNDIQTYNGALIYLDELKVELQWNSNNVAYKKLADLVRLKFE